MPFKHAQTVRFAVSTKMLGWLCVTAMGLSLAGTSYSEETKTESIADLPVKDLDSLSAEQKRDLLRRKQQFDQLTPEEQARLRKFHAELNAEPAAEQLTAVMNRYHEWLLTLKPLERDELLSLPPEERITRIKRLMQQQEKERFEQMVDKVPAEDLDVIYRWIDAFILEHQSAIVESIPPEFRRRFEQIEDEERQRRMLMFMVHYRPPGSENFAPKKEDFDRLLPQLSKQSQDVLKKAPVPGEVMREWVKAAVMSKIVPPATDERLTEFLKDLPVRERQELEGLTPQQMRERLTKMYYASRFRGGPRPGFMFGGPEHGNRNGWDGRGPDGRGPDNRGPNDRGPDGRGPYDRPPGEGRPGDRRPPPLPLIDPPPEEDPFPPPPPRD